MICCFKCCNSLWKVCTWLKIHVALWIRAPHTESCRLLFHNMSYFQGWVALEYCLDCSANFHKGVCISQKQAYAMFLTSSWTQQNLSARKACTMYYINNRQVTFAMFKQRFHYNKLWAIKKGRAEQCKLSRCMAPRE